MSWDVLIQDFPPNALQVAEIPDDFKPRNLGPRAALISKIQSLLPEVDFSDPSWGIYDSREYSIEFNIGSDEICESLMLHVRGSGDAMITVEQILRHLNLRGIDFQTGEFFRLADGKRSFEEWVAYRDCVVGDKSGESE